MIEFYKNTFTYVVIFLFHIKNFGFGERSQLFFPTNKSNYEFSLRK